MGREVGRSVGRSSISILLRLIQGDLYSRNLLYRSPWLISSQCSTVVRNTVVRAMMKVNGKHPTLGPPSSLTPDAIGLKFGTVDYVRGATPYAKNCKNRPGGVAPAQGWNIMFKGFFSGCGFLAKLWRTHFWEYRRRFCTKRRVSAGIDFLSGSHLENSKFSPISPQKHHFFGQKIFDENRPL